MRKKLLFVICILLTIILLIGGFWYLKQIIFTTDDYLLPDEYKGTLACARNGNPKCQREIAEIFEGNDYRAGTANPSSIFKPFRANKWYLKAALKGDKISIGKYGWFLCENIWGNPEHKIQPVEGMPWLLIFHNFERDKLLDIEIFGNDFGQGNCIEHVKGYMPHISFDQYMVMVEKRARELYRKINGLN